MHAQRRHHHRHATPLIPLLLALAVLCLPFDAQAQVGIALLDLPPGGGNQKASVAQWMGLVEVRIDYNSPDVTGPGGEDRRGKIWGQLVPYGMANLGFGPCGDQCPWRAGANENTVFTVSHDVEIEGQPLAAGSYGLHVIPAEEGEWTLIFSNNSTAWGSFFYDPADDALRVKVSPRPGPYTHWLSYTFTDRQLDQATAALRWEDLELPWTISVPDISDLYMARLRQQLENSPGFNHLAWSGAALYALQNAAEHPEYLTEAKAWAEAGVSAPFIGQENLTTLMVLGSVHAALGEDEKASEILLRAVRHPTSGLPQAYGVGRQLLANGEPELALTVFEAIHEHFDGAWPTEVGLARGYSAMGRYDEALKHARVALTQAPDDPNRRLLEGAVAKLERGEDMN